ncbi:MAG TPA: sigma-70 family RNA polymerase sigma factor [Clostridiaceae bacterium]
MEIRKAIKLKTKEKGIEIREMTCGETFEQFERLIYKKALEFTNSDLDIEDLNQIGSMALAKAFNAYDIEKGYLFTTLLGRVVTNDFLMQIRKESNKKKYNMCEVSFDEPFATDGCGNTLTLMNLISSPDQCEELVLKHEEIKEVNLLINELKPSHKVILKMFFIDESSQMKIAEKLNLSQSWVSKLLRELPVSLKKKYEFLEKCV